MVEKSKSWIDINRNIIISDNLALKKGIKSYDI